MSYDCDYDLVALGAEMFFRGTGVPSWIESLELVSRLSNFPDMYPESKYAVAFTAGNVPAAEGEDWRDGSLGMRKNWAGRFCGNRAAILGIGWRGLVIVWLRGSTGPL